MTDRGFTLAAVAIVITAAILLADLICQVSTDRACMWPWAPQREDDGLVLP